MLLVTSREPISAEYADEVPATRIVLRRLDPAAVPKLVQSVWSAAPMPKGLAEFVEFRTEGVPLFVEELTFLLRNRFGEEASGVADWEQVLRSDGVTSLKDLLSARIAGLGQTRTLAQVASVIGREFSYDLLTHLVDEDARPQIDAELALLLDQDLIQTTDKQNQLTFRFRHSLLQDAAYESLLKSKRRELHTDCDICAG
jgi:predicted ATPase